MAHLKDDTDRGIYQKYVVERTDGSSGPGERHEGCEYFVLDLNHDPYAVSALRAYLFACRRSHPLLAEDLQAKIDEIVLGLDRGGEGA